MAKGFALKDLYDLISVNSNISPKTAEKVWKTILDVIISELQYNDKITIDNFGKFEQIYEGGKDEYVYDEFGNVSKKYISPIVSMKFTPSINFLKRLNEDIVDQMGKVSKNNNLFFDYGEAIDKNIEKTLEDKITLALQRKNKRREKERIREENLYIPQRKGEIPKSGIDITKGQPIKCLNNGKIYSSMNKASKELDLRIANIKDSIETGKPLFGYNFIYLDDSEYEKELEELKKKRNEDAEL